MINNQIYTVDVTCEEFGTERNPLRVGVIVEKEGRLPIYDSRRIFSCESTEARFSDGLTQKNSFMFRKRQMDTCTWKLPRFTLIYSILKLKIHIEVFLHRSVFIHWLFTEQRCVPAMFVSNANVSGNISGQGCYHKLRM